MINISQILKDIEGDCLNSYLGGFYGKYEEHEIDVLIEELERLEGRKIEEDEDLDTIIDAHLDEIVSNIVQDNYSEGLLFYIVFYFSEKLSEAFASLTEEEYLEIASRDYDGFILSELIRCCMKNLTVGNDELLIKLIDKAPFAFTLGVTYPLHELLSTKGLSEKVILKVREAIVRNGGEDWEKNEDLCVEGLIFDLSELVVKFNEYRAYGKYKVEALDLYEVRSDAEELLVHLAEHQDVFIKSCKMKHRKKLDTLNLRTLNWKSTEPLDIRGSKSGEHGSKFQATSMFD